MNKREFISEYNIKDAMPIDPSSKVLPAEGFAVAIEEFINDKFCGVARASASVASYCGVLVCTEYVALFFKTLLAELYGRSFLNISITNDNELMNILIEHDGPLPLSDSQMRNIIRIARNGGMQIYPAEDSIRLTLKFEDAAIRKVYAISVNDGKRIMLSKLGEIFYCGEDYPHEPPKRAEPKLHLAKKPKSSKAKEKQNQT